MRFIATIAMAVMMAAAASPILAQTTQPAPDQPTTTEQTTTGQTTDTAAQARDDDADIGWIGLLGLLGLAGLIRRREPVVVTPGDTTAGTRTTTTRAPRDTL
jgi:MYXO-CTERM domain-containing protein